MNSTDTPQPFFSEKSRRFLLLGTGCALGFCVLAAFLSPRHFFMSWLTVILWPWSISLGSLTLLLMIVLTGGKWSETIWQRLSLHARLMPMVGLCFLPWMIGLSYVYPWTDSAYFEGLENISHRQWFLQPGFVIGRSILYFFIWIGFSWIVAGTFLRVRQKRVAESGQILIPGGQAAAGLGLIAILISVTWAAMDWIMSLDPFFTSTLFGALVGVGALLAAMAAAIAGYAFNPRNENRNPDSKLMNDLGNLLLAFVMIWAYFSLSQFLIMWSGDLPQEAAFYQRRLMNSWSWITPAHSRQLPARDGSTGAPGCPSNRKKSLNT